MKRKLLLIAAILLLLVGGGFLLFPPVSNYVGTQISHSKVKEFDRITEEIIEDKTPEQAVKDGDVIPDKENENLYVDQEGHYVVFRVYVRKLFEDSIAYNENVREHQFELLVDDDAYAAPSLDLTEYGIPDGIYGYVTIPKIDMQLPIYLGATGENMSYGAAHMTYTSLPVGGARSNCVLAGHSGYVGRIFFDNLRSLSAGDQVSVTNYWETLNYHVVQTEVRKPEESQNIYINDDRDLLTLFTCVSDDKGGFDRFYVICERDPS